MFAWQPICNAAWAANALSKVPDTSLLLKEMGRMELTKPTNSELCTEFIFLN